MTILREWFLIIGIFAVAGGLWYPILYPPTVVQLVTNDMRGSTIHIWDEHQKAPLKYTIPDLKDLEIPLEVK